MFEFASLIALISGILFALWWLSAFQEQRWQMWKLELQGLELMRRLQKRECSYVMTTQYNKRSIHPRCSQVAFVVRAFCAVKIDNLENGHLQLEHPQHAQQLRGHSQPADTPSLVLVHCIRLLHYCRSRVTSIADESPSSAIKFTARTSRRERRPLLRARQHPQQAQRHLSQHMQSKQVKTRG